MKISAKGRYGLAAMACLAQNYAAGSPITIITISEKLGISKIYLEQVFALLKRAELVTSIKGAQGGYQLSRHPRDITAYDILSAIELSLMEKAASSTKWEEMDRAIEGSVYRPLDAAIKETLSHITVSDILTAVERESTSENLMYFI